MLNNSEQFVSLLLKADQGLSNIPITQTDCNEKIRTISLLISLYNFICVIWNHFHCILNELRLDGQEFVSESQRKLAQLEKRKGLGFPVQLATVSDSQWLQTLRLAIY